MRPGQGWSVLRPRRRAAAALTLAVVAAACGGGGDSGGDATGPPEDEGTPVPGGKVIYAVEGETPSGWCLQESQLAIAGIQVARAVYDTLVQPDGNGDMVPMLATSVEPNDTFDEWTIKLREGVTFHDGSELNAEVVKNNLDAYRGQYEGRTALLFVFVLDNIDTVEATDEMTVTVTTKTPWPSFPNFLWNDGRLGITGQAQLDNADNCDKDLVGTGPFVKREWKLNDHFTAEKNPDYWQTDADANALPYLDEIEFRPQGEQGQRIEGIQTGTYDAAHIENGGAMAQAEPLAEQGAVNLVATSDYAEVAYLLLNESKPPFNNRDARLAVASALDREEMNDLLNLGKTEVASGPFAPGAIGYVADTGFPAFDLEVAKGHVAAYEEATGERLSFVAPSPGSAGDQSGPELIQSQLADAGIEMKMQTMEQAAAIDQAIAGDFDMMVWRNHPGGDPDLQYVWWHSGSPVNFGRIDDPEVDRLLEAGRVTADPDERATIYKDLNRRFAKEAHGVWTSWSKWGVISDPTVHGVMGPDIDDSGPFPGLSTGHPVSGMWVDQP